MMTKRSITSRDVRAYDIAMSTARLSTCRYRIGAVIMKGSRVLSLGCNILKSHSVHKTWLAHVVSIHAEHNAVLKANTDVFGATIFIARLGGKGISKPCSFCLAVLLEAGIKEIVYFDGAQLKKERIQ